MNFIYVMVDGFIDNKRKQLFLGVYDVSDGTLKGSKIAPLRVKKSQKHPLDIKGEIKDIFNFDTPTSLVQKNVAQLIKDCFPEFLFGSRRFPTKTVSLNLCRLYLVMFHQIRQYQQGFAF